MGKMNMAAKLPPMAEVASCSRWVALLTVVAAGVDISTI